MQYQTGKAIDDAAKNPSGGAGTFAGLGAGIGVGGVIGGQMAQQGDGPGHEPEKLPQLRFSRGGLGKICPHRLQLPGAGRSACACGLEQVLS